MAWFKIKANPVEINKKSVKRERLEARAERLVAILAERPKHPKFDALATELSSIIRTLEIREEDNKALMDKLNSNS